MRIGWLAVIFLVVIGPARIVPVQGAAPASKPSGATTAPATPPFVLSKETTYFTGPVRADGTVDYVDAINEQLSRGVTRENNAAIPLLDAITRGRTDMVGHYAKVWEKLGGPPAGPSAKADLGDATDNEPEGMHFALKNAWTAEKLPAVAKWLEARNARLDLVVEASRRSRYYLPLVREHTRDSFVSVLLPHLNHMRGLMNALMARALLRLGNEDMEGFTRDALAIVRIARLTSHGSTLIERLVAMGCESLGLNAIQIAASGGWLSAEQVEQILKELRSVPGSPVYEALELGERTFILEFLQTAAVHGVGEARRALGDLGGGRGKEPPLPPVDSAAKDWNAAMRKVNGWYKRLEDAGKRPAHTERVRLANAVIRDVEQLKSRLEGWRGLFAPIEDRLIALAMPALNRTFVTESRLQADRELTEAALALSSFRGKTGEYPATLKELVPGYFKAEPIDPFTDRPLVYRPEAGGYVLRSLGENGREDAGQWHGQGNDDRVVRAER